jgi:predicted nucleic acid-binding protein
VFLDPDRAAKVKALVSGDADLLALRDSLNEPAILDPAGFQIWLQRDPRD